MNIWYFCLDPNITLDAHHRSASIHIQETIGSLHDLGHQVNHFLYGDNLRPMERRLRRRAEVQPPADASHRSDPKSRSSRPLLRQIKPLVRDIFQLYQNSFLDSALIEPLFRENRIDIVYERLAHSRSSVSACARKWDIPFVVESNSTVVELKQYWGSPLWPLVGHVEIETVQRADAVVVISTPLKQYYEQQGVPPDKITVLPNGVNEARFSPESIAHDVRAELGFEGKTVVGFVGNTRPYHGIELLIPLARMLDLARYNIQFLVVGDGLGMDDLVTTLSREGMAIHFTFVGTVPHAQVPEYIAAMDICLMPRSNWQGSPMKLLEYGAMGKAIVAPDLGPIRDIFCHGHTAYLFELENVPEMASAISALASDGHLRAKMGEAARRHILAHHTWTRNAERMVTLFDRIRHRS